MITSETDLAELFNDYFVNVASNLKEPVTLSDNELLNNFVQSKVPTMTKFNIPLTTLTFVRNFLSNLNINKSTGLDYIGPRILKLSANVLAPSLLFIVIGESPSKCPLPKNNGYEARRAEGPLFFGNGLLRGLSPT